MMIFFCVCKLVPELKKKKISSRLDEFIEHSSMTSA